MLDKTIKDIRKAFNNGTPSGMLLGWDDERFYQDLLSLTRNGEIVNKTDFNYSFCNTYNCYFPNKQSKTREMATLQISFVSTVFQIYWDKFVKHSSIGRRIKEPETMESKRWEKSIRDFFQQKGFEECLPELYNLPIEGIELELSEKDQVKLGKCLFVDYEG